MEFIKKLETQQGDENKGERDVRSFEAVEMQNDIELSIQASWVHRCTPQKTMEPEKYSHMELAIFRNHAWSDVREVTKDKTLIDKFEQYFDGSVYNYVPVELIEELYQYLKTQTR